MKKVLSLFLVLAMMLSLVTVTSVASAAEPVTTGTELTLSNLVSALSSGGEYYMTADINWGGTAVTATPYANGFPIADGFILHANGFSWYGLSATDVSVFYVAAGSEVTINDLQIGGTDGISLYDGLFSLGAAVADDTATTEDETTAGAILNLNGVDINVKETTISAGVENAVIGAVAGLVPAGATVNMTDCTVSGTVGTKVAYDIVEEEVVVGQGTTGLAWNAGTSLNAIGGFVGYSYGKLNFTNCSMTAGLCNGDQTIGGLVGITADAGSAVSIDNCVVAPDKEVSTKYPGLLIPGGKRCAAFIAQINNTVVEIKNCVQTLDLAFKNQYVAGFIAEANGDCVVSFENCANLGDISAPNTIVAGFVGQCNDSNTFISFKNCENRGNVSGTQYVAGFIAQFKGTVDIQNCINSGNVTATTASTDSYVGGFIGNYDSGHAYPDYVGVPTYIKNCVNTGNVSGSKRVGGFVGNSAWSPMLIVDNCQNYGAVNATANDAGGLWGYMSGNASSSILVQNFVNYGTISSNGNVGGLVGELSQNATKRFVNCINVGKILRTGSGNTTGGIVGYCGLTWTAEDTEGTFVNCVNIGTIEIAEGVSMTNGRLGGIVGGANANSDVLKGVGKIVNCHSYGEFVGVPDLTNYSNILGGPDTMAASGSTGYYLAENDLEAGMDHANLTETAVATVDEAVANLNTLYADAGLNFVKNANGAIELAKAPKFAGVQETASGDKVRLVATIDSIDYAKVGFKVTSQVGSATAKNYDPSEATYAYLSIKADGVVKTAETLGGNYIYTLTFTGVPTTGTVTFTVQTYAVTEAGTELAGTVYTVVYTDGAFTSITPAL